MAKPRLQKNVGVTKHAEKRSRTRLGINKCAVERNAQRALDLGLGQADVSGKLKKYMDGVYFAHDNHGHIIRLYHRNIYIFSNDGHMITVMPIPNKFYERADKAERLRLEAVSAQSSRNGTNMPLMAAEG